jgi:hypothetical protein
MILTPSEPDLRTIVQRIDNDDIDLQPDFQRQEVWSISKKRRLIDTILRGWSIPPVHLVETADSRLEVLDGQQRLTAIRDFLHDRFSIDGRITPDNPSLMHLHGKFYKQLDPATKRRIDQYPLRCFKITDYLPNEPSELFYRLNQPTALTAGEQRNALFGPARQQLKRLVAYFEDLGNSKDTLAFSNARLAYDDIVARLLFFLEQGSFGLKSTESRVSERFRDRSPFPKEVFDVARKSIELFSADRSASDAYRFNKASVLSLLLFFSRFRDSDPSLEFLQTFILSTKKRFTSHYITEAAALFEDRASLRVTDVSSVAYRDFTLWYIYYFARGPGLPDRIPAAPIQSVERALSQRDDVTFEGCLGQLLDIEAWAATL